VILLRGLMRVLGFLLLLALALVGGALAVFSIEGGDSGLSVPALAGHLGLPGVRDTVEGFLSGLEDGSAGRVLPFLAALGVAALALLLLPGVFVPARERLVSLGSGEGRLNARRRPLAQAAGALAARTEGVTAVKAKVRPGRRLATVKVRADVTRAVSAEEVRSAIEQSLAPLTEAFDLKARVQTRDPDRGPRVQ